MSYCELMHISLPLLLVTAEGMCWPDRGLAR